MPDTMKSVGGQRTLFDGDIPLKLTKKVRLIELFAGIGAQAQALTNLGVPYEKYKICEIDKSAVDSYNAVHGTFFIPTDITKIHAADLNVENTEEYDYILTYSFPCTDLSKAGNRQGMSKNGGTRSGLLWQVEILLQEMKELPQVLLMENVPDVLADNNKKDFFLWCSFLENLGYTNRYALLNAKDFDIPQSRERCYMLSWLGDRYYYIFPQGKQKTRRLKDMLESYVPEKYYLKPKEIESLNLGCVADSRRFYRQAFETVKGGNCECGDTIDAFNMRVNKSGISPTITTRPEGFKTAIIVVDEPIVYDGYNGTVKRNGGYVGTLTTNCGADLKRNGQGVIESTTRIRKLTPKECWRLMGFDDESYSRAAKVTSHSKLYKQAGNSIVVDVLMEIFRELF